MKYSVIVWNEKNENLKSGENRLYPQMPQTVNNLALQHGLGLHPRRGEGSSESKLTLASAPRKERWAIKRSREYRVVNPKIVVPGNKIQIITIKVK